jgi:hypothetical protein
VDLTAARYRPWEPAGAGWAYDTPADLDHAAGASANRRGNLLVDMAPGGTTLAA